MTFPIRLVSGFYRLNALILLLLFFTGASLGQSASGMYDNPEFKKWSSGFINGKLDETLLSVEKNLQSNESHPLADFVWVQIHKLKGDLDNAIKSAPESFKKEVEITAKLVLRNDDDLYAQTWEQFSSEEIRSNNSPYRAYIWSRMFSIFLKRRVMIYPLPA